MRGQIITYILHVFFFCFVRGGGGCASRAFISILMNGILLHGTMVINALSERVEHAYNQD